MGKNQSLLSFYRFLRLLLLEVLLCRPGAAKNKHVAMPAFGICFAMLAVRATNGSMGFLDKSDFEAPAESWLHSVLLWCT